MAWTNALDNATPAGGDAPSTLDDQIRLVKAANQERLNVDHYWPLTGTAVSSTDAGKHRKVTAQAVLSSKPTLLTGEAALYTKTVDGVSEWFWEDSDENEHQLTNSGALNVSIAEILGLLTNDTYFTGIDEAGTGTVNLIKAGRNEADDTDVAVLPDLVRTATNAAPLEDTAIPNMKYVDDQLATKDFGSRTANDVDSNALIKDTVYLATCDGFLGASGPSGRLVKILAGETANPTFIVANGGNYEDATFSDFVSYPVTSGEYVKVESYYTPVIWFKPIGTGGLDKQ